ncbi:MAG: hypothetical protein IKN54_04720 [Lachnospiraceae bacterium]|nr:hypothetical protein [Lachnospiraceae bacterium]
MEYMFVIKGNLYGKNRVMPDLNNYLAACNRHHMRGAQLKKDYMMIASNFIRRQLGDIKIKGKVHIHYKHFEADKRRDPSNIASFATKVIEDALQVCGVLSNDGWENIVGYSQEFAVDKENPRIEVYIKEVG